MKTTLFTIALLLILFLQVAQTGEIKRLREHPASAAPRADVEQLHSYLDLIERYSTIAKDPSRSGTAAVLYTKELRKGLSTELAIDYYTRLLPDVHDDAIRRAIRFELVDLYLHSAPADREKAMEQLRILMTSSKSSSSDWVEPSPATQPTAAAIP